MYQRYKRLSKKNWFVETARKKKGMPEDVRRIFICLANRIEDMLDRQARC